ncbi:MAG: RNase P subunit p30 family protein [Candidatus Bathyarchaeota archaeon]
MRRFMDLHLTPRPGQGDAMVWRAGELGYAGVAVAGEAVKDAGRIEVYTRIDLEPRNQQQLTDQLNKHRRGFTVVSVTCTTKSVARQAAKDHRVDVIKYPSDHRRKTVWMDRQQAALAAESGCCYEVEAAELMAQEPGGLEKTLKTLRRELENALKHGVPVVLSSGASTVQGLRDPRSMASFMHLLGVGEEDALDMVSDNPWALVERNRDKLSGRTVLPGVAKVE